jgi:hypothetical protein
MENKKFGFEKKGTQLERRVESGKERIIECDKAIKHVNEVLRDIADKIYGSFERIAAKIEDNEDNYFLKRGFDGLMLEIRKKYLNELNAVNDKYKFPRKIIIAKAVNWGSAGGRTEMATVFRGEELATAGAYSKSTNFKVNYLFSDDLGSTWHLGIPNEDTIHGESGHKSDLDKLLQKYTQQFLKTNQKDFDDKELNSNDLRTSLFNRGLRPVEELGWQAVY